MAAWCRCGTGTALSRSCTCRWRSCPLTRTGPASRAPLPACRPQRCPRPGLACPELLPCPGPLPAHPRSVPSACPRPWSRVTCLLVQLGCADGACAPPTRLGHEHSQHLVHSLPGCCCCSGACCQLWCWPVPPRLSCAALTHADTLLGCSQETPHWPGRSRSRCRACRPGVSWRPSCTRAAACRSTPATGGRQPAPACHLPHLALTCAPRHPPRLGCHAAGGRGDPPPASARQSRAR